MSTEHILIVDDDQLFADTLSRAFTRRGFSTDVANDSETALALAEKRPPGKAVLDLKLGNESGLDLLQSLIRLCPDIAVIILTGYSSIATAVAAMKLGAHDYVCKPADASEILAAFADRDILPEDIQLSDKPHSVKRLQWEHVQKVLEDNDGNISATARSLGMHRRSLQRYLQKKPVRE